MYKRFLPVVFIALFAFAIASLLLSKQSKPFSTLEKPAKLFPIEQPLKKDVPSSKLKSPVEGNEKKRQAPEKTLLNNQPEKGNDLFEEQENEQNENDRPDLAEEQEFMRTMNPALGRPTRENLLPIMQQMTSSGSLLSSPGSSTAPWVERGPNNVGGRTRAIMVDPNDTTRKTLWAAGVDGGLWKTTDITAASPNWTTTNAFFANMAISCMAYDSTNNDTMYFGTGEAWYNLDAVKGFGVWRTTDKGVTWTQLSSTTGSSFNYINKIVVHPTNHKVYIATRNGIYVSSNAGNTFTNIGYTGKTVSDIELANNGRIHIGIGDYFTTREYHYTDNDTTWDPIATNFNTVVTAGRRVALAVAPNNSSIVYALVGTTGAIQGIYKSSNGGITWAATGAASWVDQACASTTSDFTRGQSWYDLAIAINPNDSNNVMIGGVDLLKTTNGGTSWTQITSWWGGCSRQYVHADQHIIYYEPGSSTVAYFGNDGGIWRTSTATAATPTITGKNTNYNVTQFYACAVHPTSGSNSILAGAQDNGTQRYSTAGVNATTQATGGDGAFCFIDQTTPAYQVASYVYNNYYLSVNSGASFPTTLNSDNATGKFINPAGFDNNRHILFSAKDTGSLWRIKNITGTPTAPQSVTISGMGNYASHIHISPYTTTSSTLFVGTEGGKLFKVTSADTTSPTRTNITGASFPSGTISCVEIGASELELLVTFFNYGVVSVWYTADGGTTWANKEGNLPDMPVRWALFNPLNRNEVLLATDLGVWATTNLSSATPTWAASNTGLANVRVDMLQLRNSDKMVFAATHGRGLFSSVGFSPSPVAGFTASNLQPCINQTVTLTDTSGLTPTSWAWSISPASYSFVGGTTANSQNPQVQFTAQGVSYSVTLTATNTYGSDAITKTNYITTTSAITTNTISGTQAICLGTVPTTFTGSVATGGAPAVSVGIKVNEDFNGVLVPTGWNLVLNQNTLLLADTTLNSYGRSGTLGAIKADNYNVASGKRAQLNTKTFSATIAPELLRFDVAHATYPSATDSLIIYSSTGSGFSRLIGWASSQTLDTTTGITTANATTASFVPTSSQWTQKAITLPVGTVQVRFEFYSGFGNQIYIDRVRIDSFAFPITYLWQKSITSSSIGFSAASGTNNAQNYTSASLSLSSWFRRIAISGACTSDTSSAIAITVNSLPTATATAAGATTFCQGGNVTINANTGSGLTYQWRNNGTAISGATGSSYVASANGNYKVVVTNSNSCVDSSSAVTVVVNTLPSATATAASATTFCVGGSVTINANTGSGLTYQWRKNGANIGGATASSYVATTTGTYKVVVTNSNTCSDSSSAVSVNVISLPSATATAASATTFCQGGSVTINANTGSGLSYQWRKNGTDISGATSSGYAATTNGDYKVVVTNSSGCSDSSSAVTVIVNTLPSASATAAGATNFCQGGSVTINANTGSGLTYQWRKNGIAISGATSSGYSASTTGSYKVVVTNSNTCSDSSSAVSVTVNSLPTATATAASATTFCLGGSVTINANTGSGLSYQWRKNGADISGATGSSYSATTTGSYKVVVTNASSCSDSSSAVTVTVNSLPGATATAVGATTFCQGGNVTIDANTGSGLTYQWRKNGIAISGATASSYVANASGNYKVVVTNSNSCSDSSSAVTVVVNALPGSTATPVGSTSICQGGSVTINANTGSGITYQWRKNGADISGATSSSYSATTTGIYKVVETNSNSCSDSSSAVGVIVNTLPTATATAFGATTFCQGGSVTINANTGSGLTYQWRKNGIDISGATSSSYSANASGNYKVVVSNSNSCSDSSSAVTVTVNVLPTATATAASATSFCPGGSVTINANTGSGLSYQWRKDGTAISGATSSSYTATTTGNYKVVETNSNSCFDSSNAVSVTLNSLPTATATAASATTFCLGGSVTINANTGSGLTYQWRKNVTDINGATSSSYSATTTGSYKVVVTNSSGCADSSGAVTVTVNSLPGATATAAGATSFCQGGSVTINANAGSGLTYQWRKNGTAISGATSSSYLANASGNYKVVVTNSNGCFDSSSAVTVVVNAPPTATATASGATTFCQGGSVTINANTGTGLSYEWRNNGTTISGAVGASYSATTAGNYKVVVSNANGCKDSSAAVSVTVNPLPPTPAITRSGFILSTINIAVGYQWLRNDTVITGAIQMNYNVTINGVYKLKITDANGCSSYSNSVTVGNVGIKINYATGKIAIYPNPASTKLTIRGYHLALENTRYDIINSIGQTVLSGDLKENETEINIEAIAVGVYLIRVGDEVQKFVKE
jgi:hypothetical protein